MSDQDFFFDEEPAKQEKAADKPAKSTASRSSSKPSTSKAAQSKPEPAPVATPIFEQSVSMGVAGMLGVIGILIGVILGFLMGGMGSAANQPAETSLPAPATSGQTAPALTPQQLQEGTAGALPPGHPTIGATGTAAP